MIKSELRIYKRETKKKGKSPDSKPNVSKQYLIRIKQSEVAEDILKKYNDKDIVYIAHIDEYNERKTRLQELKDMVKNLQNDNIALTNKYEDKLNKANRELKQRNETIDTQRADYDRLLTNKNHINERLNKALLQINSLENELNKNIFSLFYKRLKDRMSLAAPVDNPENKE